MAAIVNLRIEKDGPPHCPHDRGHREHSLDASYTNQKAWLTLALGLKGQQASLNKEHAQVF